ncbi:heme ABC transporter ATP-binding protein [Vibrio gangliei]|uniref:heme ABC transporter ATP-binding protein n=1 Tax=Vibrio gangliei TaxID=2077090 RepID=UPI001FE3CC50|nr:heme ABC transporter ATP-binding protein [Vibrio gangliei]
MFTMNVLSKRMPVQQIERDKKVFVRAKEQATSQHDIAIKARNLSLHYGKKNILNQLNLDIYQGKVTALLGPNGAGKSSLLKILCGESVCSSHEASLHYFGKPNVDWDKGLLARHLGILPQHSTLSFPFLVREVVELGGLPLGLPRKELALIAEEKMEQVGILSMASRHYPQLSGGEKQRVHLARVLTQLHLAQDNRIFMLDEPTSALDLAHQHNTLSLAKQMAQAGTAVVVVLHDLNLATQYADRILLLQGGNIVADGSAWQTLSPDNIYNVYGQSTLISTHPEYGFPVIMPK